MASSSRLRVKEGLQCTTSAMHKHTHTHLASQTSSRGTGFQLMRTKHSVNSRHVLRILTQLVRRWRQLCLEGCIPSGPHGTCLMFTMRVAGYLCQWFHCINCMSKADDHDACCKPLNPAHTAHRYQYEGSRGMATLKERKLHWREIVCGNQVVL